MVDRRKHVLFPWLEKTELVFTYQMKRHTYWLQIDNVAIGYILGVISRHLGIDAREHALYRGTFRFANCDNANKYNFIDGSVIDIIRLTTQPPGNQQHVVPPTHPSLQVWIDACRRKERYVKIPLDDKPARIVRTYPPDTLIPSMDHRLNSTVIECDWLDDSEL